MTTRPTPPAVRPMSDATRQRIRRHVLDSAAATGPGRPRRWLPAVAAVAAVAVVAGIAVGTGRLTGDRDPTPQAAGSAHPDPRAIVVDRGAPSASQLRVAKQACLGERPGPATVLLARRVSWRPAPITPETVTAIVLRTSGGEYLACHTMDQKAAASAPEPTANEPLKLFAYSGLAEFYRVHPSVARIETRVSWPERGRPSDWSVAVIANGVAYVLGDALEVRAFDAAGRQLEIPNRVPPQPPTPTPDR